jgi:hypothetical protein
MKRWILLSILGLAALPAAAAGQLADVSIIDRATGMALPVYEHDGEFWVEGRPGARYAIQIRSQQERRLMAVTSVDGINVITGETARFEQSGYVFDPFSEYRISGWRKSDSQIAAFEFTSVSNSYAARTGRAGNVGVIGIALFCERQRPIPMVAPPVAKLEAPAAEAQSKAADASAASEVAGAVRGKARAEQRVEGDYPSPLPRSPGLGTGHGQREESYVTQVDFEREQRQPNEIIRIRYDSHANLIAMGVIPREHYPRYTPNPFPEERGLAYVPDP